MANNLLLFLRLAPDVLGGGFEEDICLFAENSGWLGSAVKTMPDPFPIISYFVAKVGTRWLQSHRQLLQNFLLPKLARREHNPSEIFEWIVQEVYSGDCEQFKTDYITTLMENHSLMDYFAMVDRQVDLISKFEQDLPLAQELVNKLFPQFDRIFGIFLERGIAQRLDWSRILLALLPHGFVDLPTLVECHKHKIPLPENVLNPIALSFANAGAGGSEKRLIEGIEFLASIGHRVLEIDWTQLFFALNYSFGKNFFPRLEQLFALVPFAPSSKTCSCYATVHSE